MIVGHSRTNCQAKGSYQPEGHLKCSTTFPRLLFAEQGPGSVADRVSLPNQQPAFHLKIVGQQMVMYGGVLEYGYQNSWMVFFMEHPMKIETGEYPGTSWNVMRFETPDPNS